MLSRIAQGLFAMGRDIERAANVARILEVHHKMNLQNRGVAREDSWLPITDAFDLDLRGGGEAAVYAALVFSPDDESSVLACIRRAREQGRTKRDHLSEEMWLHLNGFYLWLRDLDFAAVRRRGRSEFNRQVESFCDGFHGIADSTLLRGPEWSFLCLGKYLERARMMCRITEIKAKVLSLTPLEAGTPVDYQQWQALLRSVSGYEAYRRFHDARILPHRVLEFLLQNPAFPRSLHHCLLRVRESMNAIAEGDLQRRPSHALVDELLAGIRHIDPRAMVERDQLALELAQLGARCDQLAESVDTAFFRRMIPVREGHSMQGRVQQ
ncbi:MAG: alpha-E domain-containing protein [Myxococcota bacterium]